MSIFLVDTYLIAWVCTCLLASPCTFIFALYFLEYAGGLPIIVLGKCICIFVFPMKKSHVLQVLYDMHNKTCAMIYLVSEGHPTTKYKYFPGTSTFHSESLWIAFLTLKETPLVSPSLCCLCPLLKF